MNRPVTPLTLSRPVLLGGLLLMVALSLTLPASAQNNALEDARRAYLLMDDAQALLLVNEYLVGDPLHVNASDLRARCLMYLGRFQEAVDTLQRLKNPPMRVRLLLAEVTALAGDTDKGLAMVDQILLDDPAAGVPRVARAKILLKAGHFQRARVELEQIRTTDPKNAEGTIALAMCYEGLRFYQDAVQLYSTFLQAPDSFRQHDPHLQRDAVEGVARSFEMMGRFEDAIHWYEQLTTKFPDNAQYLYRYGLSLGMRGRIAEAVAQLEKAVQIAPNPLVRSRLGDLYQSNQQVEKAIEQYELLLNETEDPRLPTLRLTELFLESGELDKAMVHCMAIEQLDPENPQVQELVGLVSEKTGDPEKAEASYRKAFALSSLQYQSIYRLGLMLSSSDDAARQAEGKALLERYQRVAPYLADIDRARNQARINPNSVGVMVQIAGITNMAQEYETAALWARRALSAQPANAQILALSGCIAANMGRTQDALALFKQVQEALKAAGQEPTTQIQAYIDTIEAGEPLPLPLGELTRPTNPPEGGDQ